MKRILETLLYYKSVEVNKIFNFFEEIISVEVHGFSDAGQKAYGCCVYLTYKLEDNSTSTCLVASKSGVTPTHSLTIPRIELQAAELLSKFMKLIYEHLTLSERIDVVYCWTDSIIVLA